MSENEQKAGCVEDAMRAEIQVATHLRWLRNLRDRIDMGGDISSKLKRPKRLAALDAAIAALEAAALPPARSGEAVVGVRVRATVACEPYYRVDQEGVVVETHAGMLSVQWDEPNYGAGRWFIHRAEAEVIAPAPQDSVRVGDGAVAWRYRYFDKTTGVGFWRFSVGEPQRSSETGNLGFEKHPMFDLTTPAPAAGADGEGKLTVFLSDGAGQSAGGGR